MIRNGDTFDQEWNTFLIDLREDSNTCLVPNMISCHTLLVHHPYKGRTQVLNSTLKIITLT